MSGSEMQRGADLIRAAARIVVLTGAGISTASGIPDFRGPRGVWTTDPDAEKLSDIRYYMSDPAIRAKAWQGRLHHPAWSARPNAGHRALVELERAGRLELLVTQNIDGLHRAAGTSSDLLVEIHGSIREVVCMSCDRRGPMEEALDRVRAGEVDPDCRSCGGILKSATVSFGQSLDAADLRTARRATTACDLFLAVGTSLSVFPVAALPRVALAAGARLAIVNQEPTPLDGAAEVVVRGRIEEVLPRLVGSKEPVAGHRAGIPSREGTERATTA